MLEVEPTGQQRGRTADGSGRKCRGHIAPSFRNLTGSATVRMWSGRAFQVAGPVCGCKQYMISHGADVVGQSVPGDRTRMWV